MTTANRYEDMTPDQRVRLRAHDGGEERLEALRTDWESRGRPRTGAAVAIAADRFEDLTVDDIVRLRQADGGEETLAKLRESWKARGEPKRRMTA